MKKLFQDEEIAHRVIKDCSQKVFDGDILNSIAIFEEEFIRMFKNFDPVSKYIMSRKNGRLAEYFAITKGQLIDLYHFATFDDAEGLEEGVSQDVLMEHVRKEMEREKAMNR